MIHVGGAVKLRPYFFAFAAIAFGCSHKDNGTGAPPPLTSGSIATTEMWASMSAQCYDTATIKVYASVLKGSDFISLDTGDAFTATVGSQTLPLTLEPMTGASVHYTASFPASMQASNVTIALMRGAGMQSAPMSKTVVPAAFEITSPAPPTVAYTKPLSVTIAPPPVIADINIERMAISISGSCLADHDPYLLTFDAQGTALFDLSVLQFAQGAMTGCDIGVQIRHEYNGPHDPAFGNGPQVQGLQARNFSTSLVLM
jgi:hypothetical protein